MTYLDTHVAVWLYAGDTKRLSDTARRQIDRAKVLAISGASVLELELLHEIGRIRVRSAQILAALYKDIGLRVCDISFDKIGSEAADIKWTREPFDRLIVANAQLQKAPLVSKDEQIRRHYRNAVW